MELLKTFETWWGNLGITAKQATIVESVIDKTRPFPISCPSCQKYHNSNDFHDCEGVFDELRVYLNCATNSVFKRLSVAYHLPLKDRHGIREQVVKNINNMYESARNELIAKYYKKLDGMHNPIEYLEEELWNS